MSLREFLSSMDFGVLAAEDFFLAQTGFLALTALLFIASLVLCALAFRAAGGANKARRESEAHMQSAQDLAIEVRHLTAQVEISAKRAAAGRNDRPAEMLLENGSVPVSPVRVGALETTPEAEIELATASAAPGIDGDENVKSLETARDAAAVPSALVGGLLRRRR